MRMHASHARARISRAQMTVASNDDKGGKGGGGIALLPHHTQILVMLMLVHFYEDRDAWKSDYNALIMQMKTGEGKSIVIAMLAIFMVQV